MRNRHARHHRLTPGFTLVECVCAIIVIGVTSAVVFPVINSATTGYANATRAREVSDDVSYAMDRALLLLRDTPVATSTGNAQLSTLTSTSVTFTDARSLALVSGKLQMTTASGATAPLLSNVESFTLAAFGQNGVTSTLASPAGTWMYTVRIKASGFELRGAAFVRARSLGT